MSEYYRIYLGGGDYIRDYFPTEGDAVSYAISVMGLGAGDDITIHEVDEITPDWVSERIYEYGFNNFSPKPHETDIGGSLSRQEWIIFDWAENIKSEITEYAKKNMKFFLKKIWEDCVKAILGKSYRNHPISLSFLPDGIGYSDDFGYIIDRYDYTISKSDVAEIRGIPIYTPTVL